MGMLNPHEEGPRKIHSPTLTVSWPQVVGLPMAQVHLATFCISAVLRMIICLRDLPTVCTMCATRSPRPHGCAPLSILGNLHADIARSLRRSEVLSLFFLLAVSGSKMMAGINSG
jgi:hypothetical protein